MVTFFSFLSFDRRRRWRDGHVAGVSTKSASFSEKSTSVRSVSHDDRTPKDGWSRQRNSGIADRERTKKHQPSNCIATARDVQS
ncbi:hypothetical protein ACVIHI_000190 [Bradyrhizobium sp. USDA 4524]|uniref:hypothetical protein n=1 Tax=unclassified Bradyrhizobium TaxID=2631580 RepID=UPI0020A20D30|nr:MULTISPECIES: hypothetical protein [unclassified Bradyrhizobium]MCP1838443.1 hypothetical protein [Bradyrhizobium sp. USDA 4538]MCP1899007.1 hypothetical protein [Bradyrhizobium sp. USDA 4537]MCP1986879.1 hypothetical protein [Bradyrhizobium sp. USDA 4539]